MYTPWVDEFTYLEIVMHGTKGLRPVIDLLCKHCGSCRLVLSSDYQESHGLQRRCQQLSIHDPVLKGKLPKVIDTLVRPILFYCCQATSGTFLGAKRLLMIWIKLRFLKVLLQEVPSKTRGTLCSGPYKDTPRIGRVRTPALAAERKRLISVVYSH